MCSVSFFRIFSASWGTLRAKSQTTTSKIYAKVFFHGSLVLGWLSRIVRELWSFLSFLWCFMNFILSHICYIYLNVFQHLVLHVPTRSHLLQSVVPISAGSTILKLDTSLLPKPFRYFKIFASWLINKKKKPSGTALNSQFKFLICHNICSL